MRRYLAVCVALASCVLVGASSRPACTTLDNRIVSNPGLYCLVSDIKHHVDIRADNVTLDLRGHCIRGSGDPKATKAGVNIRQGRRNVTIANGCITGFMYGVRAGGPTGPRSSHITLSKLRLTDHSFRGAMVFAEETTVEDSHVERIGGTEVYKDAYAMGLEIRGNNCRIARNVVREVYPTGSGEGIGISLSNYEPTDCVVADNFIANSRLSLTGNTFGMWVAPVARIENNVVRNFTYGIYVPRAASLRGNVVIGEQCVGGYRVTNTIYRPLLAQPECPDSFTAATRNLDFNDRYSVYRLARMYQREYNDSEAIRLFRRAAELGSHEGRRYLELLLAK